MLLTQMNTALEVLVGQSEMDKRCPASVFSRRNGLRIYKHLPLFVPCLILGAGSYAGLVSTALILGQLLRR